MKLCMSHLSGALWALPCIAFNTSVALAQSDLLTYDFSRDPTPRTSDPAVVAEYEVLVDLAGLKDSYHRAVELQLPDGSRYSVVPEKIEAGDDNRSVCDDEGENSFSWQGALNGDRSNGSALITILRGFIAGSLTFPGRYAYELRPGSKPGTARLLVFDTSLLEDGCGVDSGPSYSDQDKHPTDWIAPSVSVELPTRASDGDIYVDLLMLYTPRAAACAANPTGSDCNDQGNSHGTGPIEAAICAGVMHTNQAFENSGVPHLIVRAVHMHEVEYDKDNPNNDPDSGIDQLIWLREKLDEDPPENPLQTLRNTHSADLVALVTEDMGPDNTGYSHVLRKHFLTGDLDDFIETRASSVTVRRRLVTNHVFTHELGHNFGLEHNPQNAQGRPYSGSRVASYPWSYGHWELGTFRTIMSYSFPCRCAWKDDNSKSCDLDGSPGDANRTCCNPDSSNDCQCEYFTTSCPRIHTFSNPAIMHAGSGDPTGIAGERDNAMTLELTGPIVAAFRLGPNDPIPETYPWLPAIYNLIFN